MPNGRGGIVDDILVYRVDAETYMLCVNAANIEKDWNHICEQGRAFGMEAGHGKELYNASDEICQLAVQGPLAMKIVQKMCDGAGRGDGVLHLQKDEGRRLRRHPFDHGLYRIGRLRDLRGQRRRRQTLEGALGGRRGVRAQEYRSAARAIRCVWRRASASTATTSTTPPRRIEGGLGWITKFAEGKEFIDRAPCWRSRKPRGVTRRLVGIQDDRPRHSAPRLRDRRARRYGGSAMSLRVRCRPA